MIWVELALIVGLIAFNGFPSMAEMAIVSSRKPRLRLLANRGRKGAAIALQLAEKPGTFLSTVQIGITLVGVLAGAFSGATLAERFADYLEINFSLSEPVAESVSLTLIVAGVTYLSLIVGELIPKQLALRNPERMASRVARPMQILGRVVGPAVSLLDISTRLGLGILRLEAIPERRVREDEIKMIVAEAETAGVLETAEKEMIASIMRLGNQPVRALMTPRYDVDWIDVTDGPDEALKALRCIRRSVIPIARQTIDNIEGVVLAKDLLDACLDGKPLDMMAMMRPLTFVPDTLSALDVIERIKESPVHTVGIVDEHGGFEGLITMTDVLDRSPEAFTTTKKKHRNRTRSGAKMAPGCSTGPCHLTRWRSTLGFRYRRNGTTSPSRDLSCRPFEHCLPLEQRSSGPVGASK